MAREFGRSARVSAQLQKELALVLQQNIKDPRLGFITVNEVDVARDMAVAKIYITVLNATEQQRQENIKCLNKAAAYIRVEVGKRMRMRSIPELRFFYDDSFEKGIRVAELLNNGHLCTKPDKE